MTGANEDGFRFSASMAVMRKGDEEKKVSRLRLPSVDLHAVRTAYWSLRLFGYRCVKTF